MRLLSIIFLSLFLSLTSYAADSAPAEKEKSIDYDVLMKRVIMESTAEWNGWIDEMKEMGDSAELIKGEEESRDAYAAALTAIMKSDDVNVKRAMILYEYTYRVNSAMSELEYAEEIKDKLVATTKLAAGKKRLEDFKKLIAAEDAKNKAESSNP